MIWLFVVPFVRAVFKGELAQFLLNWSFVAENVYRKRDEMVAARVETRYMSLRMSYVS